MSTAQSLVSTKEPVVSSSWINHVTEWNANGEFITGSFATAAIVSSFGTIATVALSLATSMDFLTGLAVAVGLTSTSFLSAHNRRMKKVAMAQALTTSRLTSRQKAEVVSSITKFTRFPHGQYLPISTSTVIENGHSYKEEDRYLWRSAESATHNLEQGLYFMPHGVFLKKTVTPMATAVWDDAMKAAEKVHFGK